MSAPSSATTSSTAETVDVPGWLAERIQAALGEAFGPDFASADPMLTPATRPEFGDYQCNVALKLAKQLGQKPRDVASRLVEAVALGEVCEPPEIAGPGFLNLRLQRGFVEAQLGMMSAGGPTCGVPKASAPFSALF
jgi:arginyl-tRNA synthetase